MLLSAIIAARQPSPSTLADNYSFMKFETTRLIYKSTSNFERAALRYRSAAFFVLEIDYQF